MKSVHKFLVVFFGVLLCACASEQDAASSLSETGQSGSITRFALHNGFMYVLNSNQVQTFTLSTPDEPQLVHELATDWGLETIFIYENTLYLGSRTGLYILSLGDPAAPSILSQTDRTGIFFGGCDPVVVQDNVAYSTVKIIQNVCGQINAFSALLVYDVSNPNAPQEIGDYALGLPNGLAILGNYLLVCDEDADKVIPFDISDPTNLEQRNDLAVAIQDPIDLIINGNRLIVSHKRGFTIYDVSDVQGISLIDEILI